MNDSNVIIKRLYPLVSGLLAKNDAKFRDNIAKFINARHELLFDIAPYDVIYFNQTDIDNMYKALGTTENEVRDIMKDCFFWDKPYNPQCAKEPYVMTLLMCIRYYLKNNKSTYAKLTAVYLAFSGKFYASLHGGAAFPSVPPSKYKTVMDFVVNNMLTDKFDLKRTGTVFGAVESLCVTWLDTYETDNLDEDNFRLTDNDAATAARITENVMNSITSSYISLDICNKCKDQNIKPLEIKDIMESIVRDNDNLAELRRVINILIADFMQNNPGQRVGSIEFVSYSLKMKPNTKDKYLIEMKSAILSWLDENSPNYRKRKSRKATQISYYKAILMYIVLYINKIAR